MSDETKPRFSFEISEVQRLRCVKLLSSYGLRKAIFGKILDDVLDLIDEKGGLAIGILMTPSIKTTDIIPSMQEVEQLTKKNGKKK